MSKIVLYTVPFCLLAFAGCGRPRQIVSSDPVCFGFEMEQTMQAAKTVLQNMHFELEKDDPLVNYIRTRPLPGAQFFQFWRQDNADAYMTSQANMHSLRRIVEMEFYPKGESVCIACRVHVQKLSVPEKPFEGYRNVAAAFTESEPTEQSIRLDDSRLEEMEWLDAGLDRALEQKILKRMQKRLLKGTAR